MTQRTLKVEHPGTHAPSDEQISKALTAALREDKLVRDGDYKVVSYSETSGGPSTYVVDVPTKASSAGDASDSEPTPETATDAETSTAKTAAKK
jgi:hypothetical protein